MTHWYIDRGTEEIVNLVYYPVLWNCQSGLLTYTKPYVSLVCYPMQLYCQWCLPIYHKASQRMHPCCFVDRVIYSPACDSDSIITMITFSFLFFFKSVEVVVLQRYLRGVTWNCYRLGARSVYTIQPCTRLQCHFIRSHTRRVHACVSCNLAATCTTGKMTGTFYVHLL